MRNRIEGLEKELKSQDIELKTANKMIKDKSNDVSVSLTKFVFGLFLNFFFYCFQMKQIGTLNNQILTHLNELTTIQKEMDKVLQLRPV